jgi:hypothetical protein
MKNVLVWTALLAAMTAAVLPGQYSRRRSVATATAGPYNGPAVSFNGTVKALTKKEIIIDLDSEEESLTLRRSGKTKFFKDDKEIKAADIPVGTHVTLDATRDGDQKLSALKVMVAPAAAPAGTSVAAPAAAAKATNP